MTEHPLVFPVKQSLYLFVRTKTLSLFLSLCLQKVSEKVGGAEGTKLDDDFKEMEKVTLQRN